MLRAKHPMKATAHPARHLGDERPPARDVRRDSLPRCSPRMRVSPRIEPSRMAIPTPYGPYSHSRIAGQFILLAGQTARDGATGRIIDGDVALQTARAIEIIREILEEHDLTLKDVVRTTVYLATMEDFDAMNGVYATHFESPFPVRSTVEVRMPYGALVGIEATAFRP